MTLASRNYSSYNLSGYLSPEAALDLELMSPEAAESNKLPRDVNSSNKNPSDSDTVNNTEQYNNPAPEMELLEHCENNCYRPTDEPEPWDLIQLNVQASLMCLSSKINSFCNRMLNKECDVSIRIENTCDNQQKQTVDSRVNNDVKVGTLDYVSKHNLSNPPGVGKVGCNSEKSSCSVSPDVSPCEEDSGIGLERIPSEMERTDCISEGGLSNDEEKRDDLPLDRLDSLLKPEKDECLVVTLTPDLVYKSSKLESIMERSVEDLDVSDHSAAESNGNYDEDSLLTDVPKGEMKLESEKDEKEVVGSVTNVEIEVLSEENETSKGLSEITEVNSDEERGNAEVTNSDEITTAESEKDEVATEENSETSNTNNEDEVDSSKKLSSESKEESQPKKEVDNSSSEAEKSVDWLAEVRPSVRKLRQAMDGLMRTARLVHSVFRLQQKPDDAQKAYKVKYRRDVCFSQAVSFF